MTSDIRWNGLDHPAIHKMINAGAGPNASDTPSDFWKMLTEGLKEISEVLHKKLGDLNVHWEGLSADQALAGMTPLKEWAGKAQTGSDVMRQSFELQGTYVGDARNEVPPPKEVTTPSPSGWQVAGAIAAGAVGIGGPAAAVAQQSADHEAQERAQDEAARQAVQAMQKYEKSSDWNADTLGHFDDPPKLVVETPPPAPGLHQGSVETSGMYNTTGVHNNQSTSTSSVHHTPIGSNTSQSHVTPNQTYTPPQTTNPNQFTPLQTYPTPPQNNPGIPPKPPIQPPYPPNQGPYGPFGTGPYPPGTGPYSGQGGPNTNMRPGIPGGGSGQGGPGGRGGLGNPNAGFGQNSIMDEGKQGRPGGNPFMQEGAARGGPAGGGAAGRGGAGGMAPGGRADGEEDAEHETPDYLMETDDIFGDERMIAPSVIGEKPEQQ